jgi:hypothetical protein
LLVTSFAGWLALLNGGSLFITMETLYEDIQELVKEFGDEFHIMFANCYLQGMDTETAYYYCYNKLKCK